MPPPRILVTRSPHQASALADCLRALGAEPILIPTIELTDPTSFAPLDTALQQLSQPPTSALAPGPGPFDWLIFTSANAVEAFERRRRLLSTGSLPKDLRIASIGAATSRALTATGLSTDLQPPQATAESLATALLPHTRQPDGSPARFLLIRAEQAPENLPDALCHAGARVTIAPAYRNVTPVGSADALKALFQTAESAPDAITFTSSSTARNLFALLASAQLTVPAKTVLASIGPVTSATLRDLRHPPHTESPEATVEALAENVVKYLRLWKKA